MKVDYSFLAIAMLTLTDVTDAGTLKICLGAPNRQLNLAFRSATADLTVAEVL